MAIVMNLDEQCLIETSDQVLKRHMKKTDRQIWVEAIPKNIAHVFPKVNNVDDLATDY